MGTRLTESQCKNLYKKAQEDIFLPMEIAYQPPSLPNGYEYPPNCGYSREHPYGYIVNLAHPKILILWNEYKKHISKSNLPFDDIERAIFEDDIILNVFPTEFSRTRYAPAGAKIAREHAKKNQEAYDKWVNYRREFFRQLKLKAG